MKGDSSINRVGFLSQTVFLIAVFCLMAATTFGYKTEFDKSNEASGNFMKSEDSFIIIAGEALSYGMTKSEAYEAKGMPDKTNRIPGEEGKEMWVYKCINDEGFKEDCLYLYFDGDKLVKIERL